MMGERRIRGGEEDTGEAEVRVRGATVCLCGGAVVLG